MIRPYRKGDKVTLDDQTRKMLNVQSDDEVQVMEGQPVTEARAQKIRRAQEQSLLHEACEFGDMLVKYVGLHDKLNLTQRAWATALGIFNVRAEYPEGSVKFDDLADQGGDDLHLESTSEVSDEAQAEEIRQGLQPLEGESLEEAAKFAETFAKYITMKKHSLGISNPQAAYGLGRAFHNLRLGFPMEEGGAIAFDEWARQAGEYYDRNK
ncbi:MAG: hypothetical protein ACYTEQ_15240 [Planctomycetota bacterium]|jgi:hypothetical protein